MTKSTTTYWNVLSPENRERWTSIKGMEGMAEELTLSIDDVTGEYTRLTRFLPGANTAVFGGKAHPYPEEVFIVSGRLYDQAFDLWLDTGHYASRPPGELHGPFKTDVGCVVLEVSFPNRVGDNNAAQRIRIDRAKPRSDPFVGRARAGAQGAPSANIFSGFTPEA